MGPERLGQLIDAHAAALALYARQWTAAPDDVVQDAFLKLARLRAEPAHATRWLYAVVRNAAISAGRSERRRQRHETAAAGPAWFVPDDGAALDAVAAAEAVNDLPPDEREAIVAHLWGGLTFEEIGELTGASAATAYRRYAAGLASLRARMGVPCPNRSTRN